MDSENLDNFFDNIIKQYKAKHQNSETDSVNQKLVL